MYDAECCLLLTAYVEKKNKKKSQRHAWGARKRAQPSLKSQLSTLQTPIALQHPAYARDQEDMVPSSHPP